MKRLLLRVACFAVRQWQVFSLPDGIYRPRKGRR